MPPLPLTVAHFADEPAFSLLARLAERNFCTTDEFCYDMGIAWDAVLAGEPNSVRRVADLSGAPADLLILTTPRHLDARRTMLHGMVLNRARISGKEIRCCLHASLNGAMKVLARHQPHLHLMWNGFMS